MKNRLMVIGSVFGLAMVAASYGFAADATFSDPAVVVAGNGGGVTGFLTPIVEVVLGGLGLLIAAGVRFIMEKLQGSKTRNVLRLAAAGVHYAESKFGADTATGIKKEQEAVDFLKSHIKGLSDESARRWVKAAYGAISAGVAPLGTTPTA